MILEDEEGEAHLSAMTVRLGDHAFFEEKRRKLGEDPLATDPDVGFVSKSFKNKKTISKLLMDQDSLPVSVTSIVRRFSLYPNRSEPERIGHDREQFDRVGTHLCR